MKILTITFFLVLGQSVLARGEQNSILRCLAKEENFYAKNKYTGPNYKLNQTMIEEVTALGNLEMTQHAYRSICKGDGYPSLKLLEHLLAKKKDVFMDHYENHNMIMVTLDALLDRSGSILITYLTSLQAIAKKPNCLENQVPEIKNMIQRYFYLETDINRKTLDGDKKAQKALFRKLNNIDQIIARCK